MGNDRRPRWIVATGAGLLAGLSLPPLGWPWLLWPALAVLWGLVAVGGGAAAAVPRPSPWAPLRAGFGWGLAAVLVSHRWLLWLHPLDWIGVPGPLSLPICLALWLACGLAAGVLVGGWGVLVARLDGRRFSTALLAAALWGLAEVWLSSGPLFWLGLGASALPADRALAGLASLGGAGLLAALQLLIGWGLWRTITAATAAARLRWSGLGLVAVLAAHLLGLALVALPVPAAGSDGDSAGGPPQRWLVVQPAIPTRQKFQPAQQQRLLRQLAAAQRQALLPDERPGGGPITGLLLPEGALSLGQPLPESAPLEVLSGGFRRQGLEQRSSVLRFAPGERTAGTWIDKHRVVPLGEWVPLAGLWRWSGLSAVGGIEPGAASRLLERPGGAVGVAICYELSDGSALAAASRDGARWLLATANLDPYPAMLQGQFRALAQLRAIETGRWLISSANTGPSLVVDPGGRVAAQLPAGRPVTGILSLRQRSDLTPYDRWGDWPLLGIAALAGLWRWRP
ncbi:apolipoprotein N-acyltransferase [Synechococcus sp. CCY 9618]|uniref:apolipoprotein N-acyltransferase n=1 Tax=Synechococcus sp. CCY 9618 TaxID=2815602 RepID=UPI001C2272F6|nr:apolipoprotein N-acyltransferase [Synechococcus sp. CCY 9618]